MARGASDLIAAAKQDVESLSPEQVASEVDAGTALLVDVRDPEERRTAGAIPRSINAPRGRIEFYADPAAASHKEGFERDRRIILHCDAGGRSALAAQTLHRMGYTSVAYLDGGMNRWKAEGRPIE